MNVLNRVLAVFMLLISSISALIVGGACAHDLLAGQGLDSRQSLISQAIAGGAAQLHRLMLLHEPVILGVSALVAVCAVLVLIVELRGVIAQPRLVLSRGTIGEVTISFDQVGMLAQHEAETMDGVREVRTLAGSKKDGIRVLQTVAVEPCQMLPMLAQEIQRKVKGSLEFHLGFPVSEVVVQLQHAPLSKALL